MVLQAAGRKVIPLRRKKVSQKKKIAIVSSLFNPKICDALKNGATRALTEQGMSAKDILFFAVPGAYEIPLVAKKVARRKDVSGVVALGCVIRGDTPHFEFVSLAATMGCLNAMLEVEKPISFGIITVNTLEQAQVRSAENHFNKGREAALALLDTLQTLENC